MACAPTRLELSNTDATTVQVTVSPAPADGESVVFEAPGLSINSTQTTTAGVASFSIPARSEATNLIFDATVQVGSNSPADAVIQIVATAAAQTVGVTVSDSSVSYCAPVTGLRTDSYNVLIETPAAKTYTIDARAATARTVSAVYAKTDVGSCTAVVRNLTDAAQIASVDVTTSGNLASSLTNTAITENERIGIEVSSVAADTSMLEIVVEYTT